MGSDREKNTITHGQFSTPENQPDVFSALFDGTSLVTTQYSKKRSCFINYQSEPVSDFEKLNSLLHKYKDRGALRTLSIANKTFTLVPEGIYMSDSKSEYLNAVFTSEQLENKKHIEETLIRPARAKCIYAVEPELKRMAAMHGYQLGHACEGNLSMIAESHQQTQKNTGFVFLYSGFFYLFLFQNGLVFSNALPLQNEADLAYYTLFSMEQRAFDGDKTRLYFARSNEGHSGALNILKRYVSDLAPLNGDHLFGFSEGLNQKAEGTGTNLFSQVLCV